MNLPCVDCLTLSRCKQKLYRQLFNECCLIEKYLPDPATACYQRNDKVLEIFHKVRPVNWHLIITHLPVHAYGKEHEEEVGRVTIYMVNEQDDNGRWTFNDHYERVLHEDNKSM